MRNPNDNHVTTATSAARARTSYHRPTTSRYNNNFSVDTPRSFRDAVRRRSRRTIAGEAIAEPCGMLLELLEDED